MGYLKTAGDPVDRRLTMLEATKKGAALHAELSLVSLARQQRLLSKLTAQELSEFERLLKLLQSEAELLLKEQRS